MAKSKLSAKKQRAMRDLATARSYIVMTVGDKGTTTTHSGDYQHLYKVLFMAIKDSPILRDLVARAYRGQIPVEFMEIFSK